MPVLESQSGPAMPISPLTVPSIVNTSFGQAATLVSNSSFCRKKPSGKPGPTPTETSSPLRAGGFSLSSSGRKRTRGDAAQGRRGRIGELVP